MDPERLRAEFPGLVERTYLNAGTCGPLPQAAVQAAFELQQRALQEGRSQAYYSAWLELRQGLREAYAGLLNAAVDDVALTTCTSEGVVRVLNGLDLGPDDEVLTAPDEHPGLLGPLVTLRARRGVQLRSAPLAELAAAVGPRTRLVACSHVSWVSGALRPAELAQLGDEVAVLLDGAQGVGAVGVDVTELGCAFYAGSGQKWLCGPVGTGMLWVSPRWSERVAPIGTTYVNLADPSAGLDAVPRPGAGRHDAPAMAAETCAAALVAHDVLAAHGWPAIHERAAGLAITLAQRLRDAGRVVAPRDTTTLVAWEDDTPPATRERLAAAGIVVRDLPGTPLLRASVGAWNDAGDLDRLLAAL